MSKPALLRLHRWITLVFALPLLAIIVTGLILSIEPLVQTSGMSGAAIEAGRVIELVKRYDPDGKARGLSIDAGSHSMTLRGTDVPPIDLATGEAASAGATLSNLFLWARVTHERLMGQAWLVTASTLAMVVVMLLGIVMGLPRLRNTLSGWHKATAWFTLPLILLSPLTGLCLAFGLTFQGGAAPAAAGRPLALTDAVRMVAASHELSHLISIGTRGGRMMARLYDGGELRAYAVTSSGVAPLPRNWPRLIHEGNWSALIAAPLNVVTSIALLILLSTGLLIWARRTLRKRRPRAEGPADAAMVGAG
ncbi:MULTISPECIES: PepSY domain-containing protein [unclassified Bradyrhizobium]|uniref:PepSY domain-containing protein n=1 Tax=unclassified Bradyrhizobium TaxID=2631580 RepID=UPI00211E38E4|nr:MULTISPECIES: PepSY domain-containing protein [unclassified Bradyrhizobium]MDD1533077.1 PepSY domain-containing protein [Bradyrhizobium sp. WBOS8]MDD1582731.1 PepSY domain-containing protein [Bradyrhizobium sp. WBOS4]UUO48400.1 PepSY domain-containing protein [Bradyrhizobium sp. WBOS04]UUO62021.1 PepSY domain-containing protein [Bradyrhizobium sp. WBOS08]